MPYHDGAERPELIDVLRRHPRTDWGRAAAQFLGFLHTDGTPGLNDLGVVQGVVDLTEPVLEIPRPVGVCESHGVCPGTVLIKGSGVEVVHNPVSALPVVHR